MAESTIIFWGAAPPTSQSCHFAASHQLLLRFCLGAESTIMFWGRGTANITEYPPGYTVRGRVCMHQWGRGGEDNRCCVHPCLGTLALVLDARLSLPCMPIAS